MQIDIKNVKAILKLSKVSFYKILLQIILIIITIYLARELCVNTGMYWLLSPLPRLQQVPNMSMSQP